VDRPNSSVSSKAKDSFSQFWETSLLAKILFIFRKEILFLGLKAKSECKPSERNTNPEAPM